VDERLARVLEPLVRDPSHGAVVCDIDGTLAPIVATPEEARVLPEALDVLERLAHRYALVACVTGRSAADGRRLVPIPSVAISGNHGLEIWRDGAVELAPQAEKHARAVHDALQALMNDGVLPQLGCRIEDKGITFTVHYRNSPRKDMARRYLETQVLPGLERRGLEARFGRMVLEVRPPVPLDKGSAVRQLRGGAPISSLLFVGDDRSDLDAFREATIRIAVRSREGPKELFQLADAVVDGPPEAVAMLEHLARAS
jgi:trehalose 6-phosphate phosphatase